MARQRVRASRIRQFAPLLQRRIASKPVGGCKRHWLLGNFDIAKEIKLSQSICGIVIALANTGLDSPSTRPLEPIRAGQSQRLRSLKHSINWLDNAPNAVPEEKATVGELRLWLNKQNVTTHMSGGTLEDHVTVALFGLVNGLVHDWWRIFGSREKQFSLRRYRTGYLLPDVRFSFDGAVFEISAHESSYIDPDLRFFGGTQEALNRDEGEAWLSDMIDQTLSRLECRGLEENSAAKRWARIKSSLRSQERSFCEAAGSLGFDPYDIEDELANFIESAEQIFDGEALIEFVGDAGKVDRRRLIGWVERMMGIKGHQYSLLDLRALAEAVEKNVPASAGERAWAVGYRRAREMRKLLGLKQTYKFQSFKDLASKLGSSKQFNVAPRVDGINALRREGPNGINVHIRNHGDGDYAPSMHLFALARSVGDVACFPDAQVSPINSLQHAYRQAAGRAFAAEFLAPIDEVKSMREDDKDEFTIANAFKVNPALIDHQLENAQRIASACD